jgi:hypothetical protein
MLRYQGREVALTNREFQLLEFLLDHPHRLFTQSQILGQAWADHALFPEEVRNYVQRLRKILAEPKIPAATSPAVATHWFSAPPRRSASRVPLLLLLPMIAEHRNQRPCEIYPYTRPFCFSFTT